MYDKFLKRLKEIREYEWNCYDIKIKEEFEDQKGVRHGETVLEAIARHMFEVCLEKEEKLLDDFQKECIFDFVDDKMNDDRNKITFIFQFLIVNGLFCKFADYVGSNYAFKEVKEKDAEDSNQVSQKSETTEVNS